MYYIKAEGQYNTSPVVVSNLAKQIAKEFNLINAIASEAGGVNLAYPNGTTATNFANLLTLIIKPTSGNPAVVVKDTTNGLTICSALMLNSGWLRIYIYSDQQIKYRVENAWTGTAFDYMWFLYVGTRYDKID